jgi:glycosyltransferase involved in cell wall biosynthesis
VNPFFSIIIPTYNRRESLIRAIESVQKQSFQDFELIVVDDCSQDDTKDILKKYPKIKTYFNTKNLGVSASRNKGIKNALGQWICFLDSDDEWLSQKLKMQFELIQSHKECVLVHTQEIWIRNGVRVNQMKKHKKAGGDQFTRSLELCVISPSSVAIKKDVLVEVGLFNENYPCCEDYDLWLRITSKYLVHYLETPLVKKYGGHEDQLSRKYIAMDYYRVCSMDELNRNFSLSPYQLEKLKIVLVKKCEILLKGYKKHNNLSNLKQIEAILANYK